MKLEPQDICPRPDVDPTCRTFGKIFHWLDVKLAYDESWEKEGWARLLNENFQILEQLIFGGTCGTGGRIGGLLAINAAGYSISGLQASIGSELATEPGISISVSPGLSITVRDEDAILFKFFITTETLSANVGNPVGTNFGIGGVDYSVTPADFVADHWFYYYVVASNDPCSTTPIGIVISNEHDHPNLFNFPEEYIFWRYLGAARWDAINQGFYVAKNVNGHTYYRDQRTVQADNNPPQMYLPLSLADFIPPTTARAVMSIKVDDNNSDGNGHILVADGSLVGSTVGGKIVLGRAPADSAGVGSWMSNEFILDADSSRNMCYRQDSDDVFQNLVIYCIGFIEAP